MTATRDRDEVLLAALELLWGAPILPSARADVLRLVPRLLVRFFCAFHPNFPRGAILRAKDDDVPEAAAVLAVFPVGLPVRPDHCPRCGSLVAHEPGAVHCPMCGRVFLLLGGAIVAQRRYEVAAGLRQRLGGAAPRDVRL